MIVVQSEEKVPGGSWHCGLNSESPSDPPAWTPAASLYLDTVSRFSLNMFTLLYAFGCGEADSFWVLALLAKMFLPSG